MSFQLESRYVTSLTEEVTNTDTTFNVSAIPETVTSGVVLVGDDDNQDNWEASYFDGATGTTLTFSNINRRGLEKDATGVTDSAAGNRKFHVAGTKVRIVNSHLYFNDKASLSEDNAHTAGKTTFTATDEVQLGIQSLTTTERNAATGITNGTLIYNETTHKLQVRENGSWKTITTS